MHLGDLLSVRRSNKFGRLGLGSVGSRLWKIDKCILHGKVVFKMINYAQWKCK